MTIRLKTFREFQNNVSLGSKYWVSLIIFGFCNFGVWLVVLVIPTVGFESIPIFLECWCRSRLVLSLSGHKLVELEEV